MTKIFYDYSLSDLEALVSELGLASYRAKQIYAWQDKGIFSFEEMTNLSKADRALLQTKIPQIGLSLIEQKVSRQENCQKFVFLLQDAGVIETVLMQYKYGYSICVSTQLGCRMACKFCASTGLGLERNLTAGEIFAQIVVVSKLIQERISHLVLMGIGEPLENLDEVLKLILRVSSPLSLNMSQRNISLSTCGLVPEIKKLASEKLAISLTVSLHAATQESRLKIMPIAKRYPLDQLLSACRYYFRKTGRRISFEYILINDINDKKSDAKALTLLLQGFPVHINLIPYNPVPGLDYETSSEESRTNFQKILDQAGLACTLRRTLGADINAACGQLRRQHKIARTTIKW